MKEKLFKLLFPEKEKLLRVKENAIENYLDEINCLNDEIDKLEVYSPTVADLMKFCTESLGIPFIDFANIDEDGKPPHYLSGLTDAARKDFIARMESIYTDDKFQIVVSYVINLLGNHAIQKADDDKMRNGKIGIIGIRTLIGEFLQAHREYADSRKPVEGFDPLEVMPG